jgi:hypothetical protein
MTGNPKLYLKKPNDIKYLGLPKSFGLEHVVII